MKQLPERFRSLRLLALILALALAAGCAPKSQNMRLAEAGQERGEPMDAAYFAAKELEAVPANNKAMRILAANFGPALDKGKLALEQATTAMASGQNLHRCLADFDESAEKMDLILAQARQLGQGAPPGVDMPILRRDMRRALAQALSVSFNGMLLAGKPVLAMDDFRLARQRICEFPEGRQACPAMSEALQKYLLEQKRMDLLLQLAKDAPAYLTPQSKAALARAAASKEKTGSRLQALEMHQALDKAGYKPSHAKADKLRTSMMRTVAIVADDQSKGFVAAPLAELSREASRQIYATAQLAKALDIGMLVRPGELDLDKIADAKGKADPRLEGATHLMVVQIIAAKVETRGPVMTKRKESGGWGDSVRVPKSLTGEEKTDKDKDDYTKVSVDHYEYDFYTETKTAQMAAVVLLADLGTRRVQRIKLADKEVARASWADNFMAVHDYGRKLLDEPPWSIREKIPPATAMPTDDVMAASLARRIAAQAAQAMVEFMGPPE